MADAQINKSILGDTPASQPKGFLDFKEVATQQGKYRKLIAERKTYEDFVSRMAKKANIDRLQDEIRTAKKGSAERKSLEEQLQETIDNIQYRALRATEAHKLNSAKMLTAEQRALYAQQEAEAIKQARAAAKEEYLLKISSEELTVEQKTELTKKYHKSVLDSVADEQEAMKKQHEFEVKGKNKVFQAIYKGYKTIEQFQESTVESTKKEIRNLKDQRDALVEIGAEMDTIQRLNEKITTMQIKQTALAARDSITKSYKSGFSQAERAWTEFAPIISARLQGTDKDYESIADLVSSNLALNPYVKTTDVLNAVKEASDKGIAYNIEQRAFLQTVSDKIAQTFDAFDSNLTRLIKLQQADTTAARLGMEASLTKFFNSMFQDTSYLSEVADTVSEAILETNSQLDRKSSAEFEYVVQKWLGSLSSLGMSSAAVTSIAQGLNYLGTGNVQALAGNNSLQTLFAMSSSRAGLSYAEMLSQGLDARTTNKLLTSMVEYLKDIATNSESQVVKAAYGDIFGLSLADLRAIQNLTASDISTISGAELSYSAMKGELKGQLSKGMYDRSNLASIVNNLYENAVYSIASDMVQMPATYAMTKMLNFMEEQGLDIDIPAISVMGNFVDLNTSVNKIMRLGLGLSSAFSLVGNIMSGLSSSGGLNLESWGAVDVLQRGTLASSSLGNILGGTSGSAYVGESSSSDIKGSALTSATSEAKETAKITNAGQKEPEKTIDDIYDLFENVFGTSSIQDNSIVKVNDRAIEKYGSAGILRVYDMQAGTFLTKLASKDNSVTIKGPLKNEALLVHVKNAQELKSKLDLQVSNIAVNIDPQSLAKAIRSAISTRSEDNNPYQYSLQDVINMIGNGELRIRPSVGATFNAHVDSASVRELSSAIKQ